MSLTTHIYNEEAITSKTALQPIPGNSTTQLLIRNKVFWPGLEMWRKNAFPQLTLPPANSWLHTWRWCLTNGKHRPKSLIWSSIYSNHCLQDKIPMSPIHLIARSQSLKAPESDLRYKKLWIKTFSIKKLQKWITTLWCKKPQQLVPDFTQIALNRPLKA